MKYLIIIAITTCSLSGLFAQNRFSLDTFLAEVLSKDFGIRIAKNQAIQAENNHNIGAAGFLPTIGVNVDQNWTINTARQTFLSGQVNEANNAQNRSINLGVMMNWTFFDGFNMFLEDKRLELMSQSAKIQTSAEMEMKLYQASVSFYTLLFLEELKVMYAESIDLSHARLKQVETRKNLGAASDMEWLQAKLDLNADSAIFLQNNRAIDLLKAEMNAMIARQADSEFQIQGSFPSQFDAPNWEETKRKGLSQNTSILQAKTMLAMREKEHKQVMSRYYPQLAFYAGYNYGQANNEVGFLLSNRAFGPQFGLTLRWDVLSGLSRMYDSKNTKIEIDNAQLFQEQRETAIASELRQAFLDFEWSIQNLKFEAQNIEWVEQSTAIMVKSMELGNVTQLQLREFQFSVVQAKTRYIEAKMNYITAKLNLALGISDFSDLLME